MLILYLLLHIQSYSQSPSIQQTHSLHISKGFNSQYESLYQQQSVLSKEALHIHHHIQCLDDKCTLKQLQLGYVPEESQTYVGLIPYFNHPSFKSRRAFIGVAYAYPRSSKAYPTNTSTQWLYATATTPSQLRIYDDEQSYLLTQIDSGITTITTDSLPQGNYPLYLATTSVDGQQDTQYQFISNVGLKEANAPYTLEYQFGLSRNALTKPITQEQLLASITQSIPNRNGHTTTYLGYINRHTHLSVAQSFIRKNVILQPAITWQQDQKTPLTLNTQLKWDTDKHLQYHVHLQRKDRALQHQHHTLYYTHPYLLAQATLHKNIDPKKTYWQASITPKKFILGEDITTKISFKAMKRSNKPLQTYIHLTMTPKQKYALPSLSYHGTNYYHKLGLHTQLSQDTRVKTSYKRHIKHSDQLGIELAHNAYVANLKAKTVVFSKPHKPNTYLLYAKTGLSINQEHIIWHPLRSVWQPAFILTAIEEKRKFWWGDDKSLATQGCLIKSTLPYTYSNICTPSIALYPGNVVSVKNLATHNKK